MGDGHTSSSTVAPVLTPGELEQMANDPNTTAEEREAITRLLEAVLYYLARQDSQEITR